MKHPRARIAGLFVIALIGAAPEATRASPPRAAGQTLKPRAPSVAVFLADPRGKTSSLHVIDPSGMDSGVLASLDHREGGALAAAVTSDGIVVASADEDPGPDLSFGATLFAIPGAGGQPRALADRLVHASRPVATPDGKVVVARGEPGIAPPAGSYRIDMLSVDEIDPATRDARILFSSEGYLLFVIGTIDNDAVVYSVGPEGAEIVAIDRTSRHAREVARVAPYARDFSIEGHGLVFLDRDETNSRAWEVVRLDVRNGTRSRPYSGGSPALVPFALPGGDVLLTLDADRGPTTLFGTGIAQRDPALGPGTAHIAAISADHAFATGTMHSSGALGRPFVIDLATGDARFLDAPPGSRATVAGFVTPSIASSGSAR